MVLAFRVKVPREEIAFVIYVDGRPVSAVHGDTVLAALVCELGWEAYAGRTTPFCGMGACYGCTVEVDGHSGERACMLRAVPGMQVRTGGAR
jgi:predicted molibdopterin-dependent oxidoreductase YjgC